MEGGARMGNSLGREGKLRAGMLFCRLVGGPQHCHLGDGLPPAPCARKHDALETFDECVGSLGKGACTKTG